LSFCYYSAARLFRHARTLEQFKLLFLLAAAGCEFGYDSAERRGELN
jgi:hypothetical protein